MPTTGQKIKAMRMLRRYGLNVGAEACMVGKRQYCDYEASKYLPHDPMITALANRYRCNEEDLIGDDWTPEAERTRETEKARRLKIFGVENVADIKLRDNTPKEQEIQLNVAAGMIEEGNKIEQEQGETIKKLRERVSYLDGIIATKDEDIRMLKAQLEFAEAGIEDAEKESDEELTKVRKELEEFKENTKQTIKEIAQLEKENKRLKAALFKVMLKQIEEQEDF